MDTLSQSGHSGTRGQLLKLLKHRGGLTVGELADDLDMTSMGVRQHLNTLERDGLVTHEREQRGMGRPSYVYSLTDAGDELFPRTYAHMANALLSAARQLDGEGGVNRLLEARNRELQAQYEARMAEKSFGERVQELARIRTDEGYMADWEQLDDDTFVLREHNCAICQIAEQCAQACAYELKLFQQVFGDATIRRETHMIRGDSSCTYVIERSSA